MSFFFRLEFFSMNKNNSFYNNKDSIATKFIKIILMVLTIIYPLTMNLLSGSGMFIEWNDSDFVFNWHKYSSEISFFGSIMIAGGLIMTSASVLCVLKKYKLSVILSPIGVTASLIALFFISRHADFAGWSDKYSMQPISSMYLHRNLPVIFPFIICVVLSSFKLFSEKNT